VNLFPEFSDQELVASTLKNRQAFAAIVERYEEPLRRYLRRLGADTEGTKDILQESFIKIYVNLNDYDAALSFSSWIYRITHNEAINYFRKQSTRPATVEKEEDLSLFENIPDELDIETESDTKARHAVVLKALKSLEENYREMLVLRFFEEKSYEEISDILQIPTGTVASYISRAKLRLKEILKKHKALDV
jgi:RNA polymerase sigma-70 factor (ECF subfamily)